MDFNNVSLDEDVPTGSGNCLGLFLLEIWSMLDAPDKRAMVAIGPEVRGQQELAIDRHDFGLVWTTAPAAKVAKWVRHGGGYDTPTSERILMGRSAIEHWTTAEPVREELVLFRYSITSYYPKQLNRKCRLRILIVNPRVIADEGLMPECVTRNDEGDIIIGNGFLTGVEASYVFFVGAGDVVSIGDHFLGSSRIQSVCLHSLCRVMYVGNYFLDECTSLTTVSFEGLSSLTRIGNSFLWGCNSLTTVSFEGLTNVTTIGNHFLCRCTTLTIVYFLGLRSVTTIGKFFLHGCTSLGSVSFEGLDSLTVIGDRFLCECYSLSTLSFTGLSNLTSVGDGFLSCCTSLITVSFDDLVCLTNIGSFFLDGCTGLTIVSFEGLNNVTTIGDWFLGGCTSLTSVYFDGLKNVTTIGHGLLEGCTSLWASHVIASDEFHRRFESQLRLSRFQCSFSRCVLS